MPQRWLVTGASGLLGHDLCRRLVRSGCAVVAIRQGHLVDAPGVDEVAADITVPGVLADLIRRHRPDVALHAAGLTSVDACEANEALAHQLHVRAAGEVAAAAASIGAIPVLISTDHLWDGSKALVPETEPVRPLNAYARTKAEGEQVFLDACATGLVARTNFFGHGRPWRQSLSDWIATTLQQGQVVSAFEDVHFTPLALADLSDALSELVARKAQGIFHVCGGERVSKLDFALRLATHLGLPVENVKPARIADAHLRAPRPLDMSLATAKVVSFLGRPMPGLDAGLQALSR